MLGGVDGLAERGWQRRQIAVGEAVIALADLRSRCVITTFDPDTVVQDADVLRQIRAAFGGKIALNAWAGKPGAVAVGDPAALLDDQVAVEFPELGRLA